jgi:hypothetical protein
MPRQTTVDVAGQERVTAFTCDNCGGAEQRRHGDIVGNVDDSARVAGWIVGPGGKPVWCPECTGRNDEYWINWGMMPDRLLAEHFAGGVSIQ